MSKVFVVGTAPYPVCVSSGVHIAPGEIVETELDADLESSISSGKLGLIERPTVLDDPVKPSIKSRKESTTTQETE